MYIRIVKEKVKYSIPMLNGEPLLMKIEGVEESTREKIITEITGTTGNTGTTEIPYEINTAIIKIGTFIESNYLSSDNPFNDIIDGLAYGRTPYYSISLDLTELDASGNTISEKQSYETTLINLLKEKVKTTLNLTDNDVEVLAEVEWRNTPQTIRLTIPVVEVIENSYYRGLMDSLITANIIKYKVGDYYILYLSYIDAEHRTVLEADDNVLIEE